MAQEQVDSLYKIKNLTANIYKKEPHILDAVYAFDIQNEIYQEITQGISEVDRDLHEMIWLSLLTFCHGDVAAATRRFKAEQGSTETQVPVEKPKQLNEIIQIRDYIKDPRPMPSKRHLGAVGD